MRYYFFEDRNGSYLDYGEDLAYIYLKSRDLKYIGWSEGKFVAEAKKNLPATKYDKETKMMKKPTKVTADLLRQAYAKEVEFAKNNPDKSLPPDRSRIGLRPQDETNPALREYMKGLE